MCKFLIAAFLLIMLLFIPNSDVRGQSNMSLYIDGQEQRFVGTPVYYNDQWWIPLRPVLMEAANFHSDLNEGTAYVQKMLRVLNEERQRNQQLSDSIHIANSISNLQDEDKKTEEEKEREKMIEFLDGLTLDLINHRDMILVDDVEKLGFDHYVFREERIIHLNSPGLMMIGRVTLGDSLYQLNQQFDHIHWNTGFSKEADLFGFYGSTTTLTFRDRYGVDRTEEVYDIQFEVTNDQLSHVIVSSSNYPTSKGIQIGDRLNDAIRAYGSQFVRHKVDGKQVVVYDVEFGSIWFIANHEQIIERIGYWNHHLVGFGKKQQEVNETSEMTD